MTSVYVRQIPAFDATKVSIVTFGYSGAQCIKNKITIYENETNSMVYENTVTTFSLSHTIPANTLINGTQYKCTITAFYMDNNVEKSIVSSVSNVFMCLDTPLWGLNISDGDIINNSYFTLVPSYTQAQSETIDEYHIVLYTSSGSVFWSSDTLYDVFAQTTVSNLPNDTVLFVRAYGTTVNGLAVDTRDSITNLDIRISIDYIAPTFYSLAYLESNKWQGYVRVKTNVSSIEGYTQSGNDAIFVENEYVNLLDDAVIFDENFKMDNNFTVDKTGYNIAVNKPYLKLIGDGYESVTTFRRGTFDIGERMFAELKIKDSDYTVYSNVIEIPSSSDIIHLWVQRRGGLYLIKISNLGVV